MAGQIIYGQWATMSEATWQVRWPPEPSQHFTNPTSGQFWRGCLGGGYLTGVADTTSDNAISGDNIAFIFPNLEGEFLPLSSTTNEGNNTGEGLEYLNPDSVFILG